MKFLFTLAMLLLVAAAYLVGRWNHSDPLPSLFPGRFVVTHGVDNLNPEMPPTPLTMLVDTATGHAWNLDKTLNYYGPRGINSYLWFYWEPILDEPEATMKQRAKQKEINAEQALSSSKK